MRPKNCLTVLHVSILAALVLTLEADSEDSDCNIELRVRHGTVYEAVFGGDLRINCTVAFCNSSPPTVTWYKRDKTEVPVNVSSSSSHIKMEWKLLNHLEGRSILVFQNVLRNDSGLYHCQTGDSVSHNIKVIVHEIPQDTFWPFVYRAVGFTVFVTIILTICVASRCRRKGKRRDTPDPCRQTSHDASPTIHIYENDRLTNVP